MDEKRTPRGHSMTAVAYVENACKWARILEDKERKRSGLGSIDEARPIVSRKTGVPKGTLLSLRKKRLKGIATHWYEKLRQGVIRELEAELRHVEHEIQIARQSGVDPRSSHLQSALSSEAKIRDALGLTPNGGE